MTRFSLTKFVKNGWNRIAKWWPFRLFMNPWTEAANKQQPIPAPHSDSTSQIISTFQTKKDDISDIIDLLKTDRIAAYTRIEALDSGIQKIIFEKVNPMHQYGFTLFAFRRLTREFCNTLRHNVFTIFMPEYKINTFKETLLMPDTPADELATTLSQFGNEFKINEDSNFSKLSDLAKTLASFNFAAIPEAKRIDYAQNLLDKNETKEAFKIIDSLGMDIPECQKSVFTNSNGSYFYAYIQHKCNQIEHEFLKSLRKLFDANKSNEFETINFKIQKWLQNESHKICKLEGILDSLIEDLCHHSICTELVAKLNQLKNICDYLKPFENLKAIEQLEATKEKLVTESAISESKIREGMLIGVTTYKDLEKLKAQNEKALQEIDSKIHELREKAFDSQPRDALANQENVTSSVASFSI